MNTINNTTSSYYNDAFFGNNTTWYITDDSSTSSCEICGWMAAVASMLAFGTFGVPIKSEASQSVDVDPLVFQSYKSFMCFVTSWIILAFGEPFTYTPWGIVSGLFWVPGGIGTIAAVKMAGLAIGIGVGSSCIVLVSFTWGIFVFGEHVHSIFGACFAVFCMISGLIGMAYYSSLEEEEEPNNNVNDNSQQNNADYHIIHSDDDDHENHEDNTQIASTENTSAAANMQESAIVVIDQGDERQQQQQQQDVDTNNNSTTNDDEVENNDENQIISEETITNHNNDKVYINFLGSKIKRRNFGIGCAVFNGLWGGSIMVPMKWSPPNTSGKGYLISFAIGASIITITFWVIRYLGNIVYYKRSPLQAYYDLPRFHVRKLWLSGATAGLLWSTGNFFSLLSVQYLGEGVGYSVTQASMLVSGLWGIFYLKEITGLDTIIRWFLAATVTVCGILLLSYEHHEN